MKKTQKRTLAIVVLILAVVAVLVLGTYLKSYFAYQRAVAALTLPEISLSQVADGTYQGACDVGFIQAQVEVTVEEGRITNISLLQHKNGRGEPAEAVLDAICREQRLDVDAISGATNSSAVLKQAVAGALMQGLTGS